MMMRRLFGPLFFCLDRVSGGENIKSGTGVFGLEFSSVSKK